MRMYENVVVLGDFNLEPGDIAFASLIQDHSLYNTTKHPTCFKSSKCRCIDFIFTNRKHSFMHSKSFETGFSDHHHMIYTILMTTYIKLPQKKNICQEYKNWSQMLFEDELRRKLILSYPSEHGNLESIVVKALETNAPTKIRIARANNKPHVTKELRRAMTRRSRLKKLNLQAKNIVLCQYRQKQ